jgi:hypothetical protein
LERLRGTQKEDKCGPLGFQSSLGGYEGFVCELMTELLFFAELLADARLNAITLSTKIHGGKALLPAPLLEGADPQRPKVRILALIGVLPS